MAERIGEIMFKEIKKILKGESTDKISLKKEISGGIELAACVVLLEVAYSDSEFTADERKFVIDVLKKDFNISQDNVEELIILGEEILENDTNKWRYMNLINETFSNIEKFKFIENIWKLIYADNRLDKYEEQIVRSLSSIFHIPHRKLIEAKLKVIED